MRQRPGITILGYSWSALSHFSLFRHLKGIIYFDAWITDCAFQFGVCQ